MSRSVKWTLLGLLAVFVIIQFFQIDKTNPPVVPEQDFLHILSPPTKMGLLIKDACYDCHSNETTWYWYTKYAPISWLIAHDVNEGREYLNFSTWDQYSENEKKELMYESIEEIEEGEMPLKIYELMHPDSKIGEEELEILTTWIKNEFGYMELNNHSD